MPATRPLASTRSAVATPMTMPPAVADQGVNALQSSVIASGGRVARRASGNDIHTTDVRAGALEDRALAGPSSEVSWTSIAQSDGVEKILVSARKYQKWRFGAAGCLLKFGRGGPKKSASGRRAGIKAGRLGPTQTRGGMRDVPIPCFARNVSSEFDRMQREMREAFDLSPSIRGFGRSGFPALNVGGTPQSVEILAFAPGLDPATRGSESGPRHPDDRRRAAGRTCLPRTTARPPSTSTSVSTGGSGASSACRTTSIPIAYRRTTATAFCTSARSAANRRSRAASPSNEPGGTTMNDTTAVTRNEEATRDDARATGRLSAPKRCCHRWT